LRARSLHDINNQGAGKLKISSKLVFSMMI
jgi:hypothetical protein